MINQEVKDQAIALCQNLFNSRAIPVMKMRCQSTRRNV